MTVRELLPILIKWHDMGWAVQEQAERVIGLHTGEVHMEGDEALNRLNPNALTEIMNFFSSVLSVGRDAQDSELTGDARDLYNRAHDLRRQILAA